MCAPLIALAAIAISAAGDITKAEAQNKRSKQNKAAALQAEIESFSALDERGRQEALAASNQKQDIQIRSLKNAGTLTAAAAQGGVAGNSVSAVLHQVDVDQDRADQRVEENLSIEREQIEREKRGVSAQTQDRINSVPRANPFAEGLSIAGDIVGGISKNPSAFGISVA